MPALISPAVQTEINKLEQPSGFVELFTLDASAFGGLIYHFTNNQSTTGGAVLFAGIAYQAIPIQTAGFDITASGTLPKPSLSIGNVSKTLLTAVLGLGDLVGAKLIRRRTYEKFLDGGIAANINAYIGPETWIIEQLTKRDKHIMQWSLTTEIDRLGFHFGRQVMKDKSIRNLYCPGVARSRIK